jgi:hypothetical protein
MFIVVLVDRISYGPILDYYNSHKPEDEEPLQRLDRFEGGFQIDIPHLKDDKSIYDPNNKIRQLRWSRGCLKSAGFIGFTENQTLILYEALVHSLGGNNVMLVNK